MEKKKTLGVLETSIVSSLSESYTMLPFMVFSSLIGGHYGVVNFFLPIVILYSLERACLVALRGFGEITNPYRILRGGLVIAAAGGLFLVLSFFWSPLLMASALLIAIGLAPAKAMIIPILSALAEEDPSLKKGQKIGRILYLSMVVATMVLGKSSIPVMPVFFFLYLLVSLWIILRLDGDYFYASAKSFDYGKRNYVFFVFALLALLSLLILRQYKESGISVLMWLTPVLVIFFAFLEIHRRKGYRTYTYQTYWAGAVSSFLLLYSLVYHSSVGNNSMSALIYVAIALGSTFSGLIGKLLGKVAPGEKKTEVAMILSALFSTMLMMPSKALNLVGILLSTAFCGIVSSSCGKKYLSDERHAVLDRPLLRLRIQTTGSIIEQLLLFFVIYILGEAGMHQNLMEAYVAGAPDSYLAPLLRSAGAICSLLLILCASLTVYISGRRQKTKK